MALGSTQPLTETRNRNLPADRERPARKADNLTAICEPIVLKMREPQRLTTLWAFTACQPYAPAVFYHQEDSWYSFLLEAESTPGP
jgi:hypothetical protein